MREYLHAFSHTYILIYISIIASGFFSGCETTKPPDDFTQTGISAVNLDSVWVYQSERMRQISVRVRPPELSAERTMICIINYENSGNFHFRLYDDGNFGRWDDSVGFADSLSGDSAPGDGVFSRRISSQFATVPGEYHMTFALTGDPPPDSLEIDILVRQNSEPVIIEHVQPAAVMSGSETDTFRAVAADPDGFEDIVSGELILFRTNPPGIGQTHFKMTRENDSTWFWLSERRLAAGLTTGQYPMTFCFKDFYQQQSGLCVYSDTFFCALENLPPQIVRIEGPDTVLIPVNVDDVTLFNYSIYVEDDQGFGDLDTLFLNLHNDNTNANFTYLDGVGELDTVALDGHFIAGFSANGGNTESRYQLDWRPSDLTGQIGETFSTFLLLKRQESALLSKDNVSNKRKVKSDHTYSSPFN